MNDIIKFDDEWLPATENVFTRWVQFQLERVTKHKINNVTKDLGNGTVIIDLARALTHRKCTPKKESLQNCDIALEMFKEDGIKIVGITGRDIAYHNEEIVLRLIWKLIKHYSIRYSFINQDKKLNGFLNENGEVMASKLLSWAVNRIENYSNTFAFKPYELSMLQLIGTFYPEKVHFSTLNPKDFKNNFQLLINLMNDLKIPCFIFPEDVIKIGSEIDQKILLTQLAVAKIALEGQDQNEEKVEERELVKNNYENDKQREMVKSKAVLESEKESNPNKETKNNNEIKYKEKKDKITKEKQQEKIRFDKITNENLKMARTVVNNFSKT